ncbi:hypothetical protein [Phaeodactylibacter luteus]|jgi:hypothetical protein|uniref:Lipoprotein n=1 Tax=Phaeodactylibacter luteus TaxID=1564516 RepID=A0A5C6RK19_9BACT|nr:hypothetical protein [Phaeodactylibacter luteus]TXB62040.1 hypothetical protein FRY97_15880 [Phaeodactylibacter luteus]
MNTRRYKVSLCFLLLMLLGCNEEKRGIQGEWSLNSNEIEKPLPSKLRAMFIYDYPYSYKEKIYITDTLLEYPLGFSDEERWPQRNFLYFQIKEDKMVIEGDTVDYKLAQKKLCIENQCFNQSDTGMGLRFQYVDLQVKYERSLSMGFKVEESGEFNLYHSELEESRKGFIPLESIDYLAKLGGRLKREQMNRIYNVGVSHAREYELFIVLNDESFAVKTFGLDGRLPFEMRAFIHNLIKSVEEEVKKE